VSDGARPERSRWRRFLPWLVLLVALPGLAVSCSGVAMGGSFSVAAASPAAEAYWRRVATGYQVAAAACLLLIVGAGAALLRRALRAWFW
jgi:hypothetical protein